MNPHWKGLIEWRRTLKNVRAAGGPALGIEKWIRRKVQAVVWPSPRIREAAGQVERIFICRSSAWTPPWHDQAFYRFVYRGEEHVDLLADERGMPPNRDWSWDEIMKIAVLETKLLKLV